MVDSNADFKQRLSMARKWLVEALRKHLGETFLLLHADKKSPTKAHVVCYCATHQVGNKMPGCRCFFKVRLIEGSFVVETKGRFWQLPNHGVIATGEGVADGSAPPAQVSRPCFPLPASLSPPPQVHDGGTDDDPENVVNDGGNVDDDESLQDAFAGLGVSDTDLQDTTSDTTDDPNDESNSTANTRSTGNTALAVRKPKKGHKNKRELQSLFSGGPAEHTRSKQK